MARNVSHAIGFVDAVWRRIVLIRVAESVGIAAAAASAAGLALAPIFWLRGQAPLTPMAGLLMLGAFCGLVWGIARRPTRLAAAMEADRQLALHDLLGTLLLIQCGKVSSDRDWAWFEAIAMTADERCRRLRPSAVIANKLGARSWCGVAISSGLLLMVCMFIGQTPRLMAEAGSENSGFANPMNRGGQVASSAAANASQARVSRQPGAGPNDENSARGFDEQVVDPSSQGSESERGHSGVSGSGAGGGMAMTKTPMTGMSRADGKAGENSSEHGTAGNGMGPGHAGGETIGDSGGEAVNPDRVVRRAAPVWETDQWPAAASAAESAIRSGRVPDSQADLVRDYFQRD